MSSGFPPEVVVPDILQMLGGINLPPNSAFIFDVDGTLVSLNGEPIRPVIDLYHRVQALGITPIIITARPALESNMLRTKEQLDSIGVRGYPFIYFLPVGEEDPYKFKFKARENVHQRGYNVIMSIGDNLFDIGQYGGIGYLISSTQI